MNSEVFQSLDGVALSAIGILLSLLLLAIVLLITKKSPKVQIFFMKIKNTIFWNFLIRYFQASFIGFNFAALTVVQKSGGGFKDIGASIVILLGQYAVVVYIAYVLFKHNHHSLNTMLIR